MRHSDIENTHSQDTHICIHTPANVCDMRCSQQSHISKPTEEPAHENQDKGCTISAIAQEWGNPKNDKNTEEKNHLKLGQKIKDCEGQWSLYHPPQRWLLRKKNQRVAQNRKKNLAFPPKFTWSFKDILEISLSGASFVGWLDGISMKGCLLKRVHTHSKQSATSCDTVGDDSAKLSFIQSQ